MTNFQLLIYQNVCSEKVNQSDYISKEDKYLSNFVVCYPVGLTEMLFLRVVFIRV